jgi:CheY-like chemotaxis protein
MDGTKILLVEDEFLIRLTLAEALTDEGFQVLESGTGAEAVATLRSHPDVALILTDIQLPGGVNGLELVRSARALRPSLLVIYMTGRPDTIAGEVDSSRDAVIAKPYLPSEVSATARRMLGA